MTLTLHLKRCVIICGFLFSYQQTFSQDNIADADSIFSKVEIEASFPGGDAAWNKYVYKAMNNADLDKFKKADQGTCRIRFIVDKKGNVTNVQAMNMKKSRLAKLGIEIIENGPKWKPAQQDGKFVNAYREQPITFTIQYEK